MGKAFTSEVVEVTAETQEIEHPYDFTLDGKIIHYRAPGSGEALLMVAATGRHTPDIQKLAAVIDLFASVIAPRDKDFVINKIYANELGPKTLFGPEGDNGILADMLEEWSGRPTKA